MTKPLLLNRPWQIAYGAADDRLNDFYIPALERSIRFDRTTGFFSSAALAIAAAGIGRLIHNGGKMRLLCGAQLSRADVDAVRKGQELQSVVSEAMVGCLAEPTDQSMRARLEALAWMVSAGRLEIKVVLPRGSDGLPLPAEQAREYYHPKEGVFEDAAGNRLAFSGSNNDSEDGWEWNYEVFSVYTTWPHRQGTDVVPALTMYVNGVERRFSSLWDGTETNWIAMDIPEAAQRALLKYRPEVAPWRDPFERVPHKDQLAPGLLPPETRRLPLREWQERVRFQYLRKAPLFLSANGLGIATGTVSPFPHQQRVIQGTVERFPARYMFCDEVGLGKTIEAGGVLRELIITGKAQRVLLLVPKSVLRQWQQELYEKFALNVPRLDSGEVLDVFDRVLPVPTGNVWNDFPQLLASSQFAKREERQPELIAADPWDVIVVDEAHHARRKEFLTPHGRPNRLMELLMGRGNRPGLRDRTSTLYLLTATPMQVHPIEVWDLLRILGLGGRWGVEENFLRYFGELRKSFNEIDWAFVLGMVRDYLETGGELDQRFAKAAEDQLGPVEAEALRQLPFTANHRAMLAHLSPKAQTMLSEFARRHTPLRRLMWRHTRNLLREYYRRGLLKQKVPTRDPRNLWIELSRGTAGERSLYDRLEEYIGKFYQKYEAERKGLGFVMTIYRRRLTSSFYAVARSLERRLDFLRGQAAQPFTDDEVEYEDLDDDVTEQLKDLPRLRQEIEYVEDFLRELQHLPMDSKMQQLLGDLNEIFATRDTVLIFTQYTDTMDYVREQLRQVYDKQVACYSGRGGEIWDGVAWVPRTKEWIKEAFRSGDTVKILLCTESASEGLNLQTCGVLINYDMPWNPMRVEQRIGRIDRLGQRHDQVWIRNYFYAGTVESDIYQRLGDRIHWFEDVVGVLQPILHRVATVIQDLAMLPPSERQQVLDATVAEIRREVEAVSVSALDLDTYLDVEEDQPESAAPPVTLPQLESWMLQSRALGKCFSAHPQFSGAYTLTWRGRRHAVTFDPALFDRYPNSLALLTYGTELLNELLEAVQAPPSVESEEGIACLETSVEGRPCAIFARPESSLAVPVETGQQLEEVLNAVPGKWSPECIASVGIVMSKWVDGQQKWRVAEAQTRAAAELGALTEATRVLLHRAGLVEAALDVPADAVFGSEAIRRLASQGFPYKGLLARISTSSTPVCQPDDQYYAELLSMSLAARKRLQAAFRQQGSALLSAWAKALERAKGQNGKGESAGVTMCWYAPSDPT